METKQESYKVVNALIHRLIVYSSTEPKSKAESRHQLCIKELIKRLK